MPAGGLGTLALIGAASAAPKVALGVKQLFDADNLKLQDTTTPEQREALAIARQRAAFGRLPGQGLQQSRLAQAQSQAMQAAALGSGSSSDFLASVSAADRNRQAGELQLGAQAEQYNGRAQGQLGQQLALQAQQRRRDLDAYNTQKAALTQGGYQNIDNAVTSAATYAAYGAGKGSTPDASPTAPPGIQGTALPGYTPALNGGRYGNSRSRYGYNSGL